MKFDNKCIKCGTTENLDTILTVTVDDVKYSVAICEEHSEDTTPKQVKALVSAKIEKLKMIMEELKEFGMEVGETNGIAVAKKAPEVAKKAPEVAKDEEKVVEATEEVYEKKESMVIKKGGLPKVRSISANVDGQSIQGGTSINTRELVKREVESIKDEKVTVPVTESIEYQTVPGRQGVPMRIPKRIKHNQGSTNVTVVDTGGDRVIQSRFKEMARATMDEKNSSTHIYGRDGYDTTECPLCGGTGENRVNGGKCVKCNGIGLLNKGFIRA